MAKAKLIKKVVKKPADTPQKVPWNYDKAVNVFSDIIMMGHTSDNVSLTFGVQSVQDATDVRVSHVVYLTYQHFFKLRKIINEQGAIIEKVLKESAEKALKEAAKIEENK